MRDHRLLVEGAIYRYRTGVAWRDLPSDLGPWQTVWKRHHRFSTEGTWDKVLTALQIQADARGEIDWRLSGRLDLGTGPSARRDPCEVAGRAQFPHRGQGRITRIGHIALSSLRIMRSGDPAAD